MGKFLVRVTVIVVAIYFLVAYYYAQFLGIDILRNTYTLLFELCVLVSAFESGNYHCKYMRWTILGIFICDCLSHIDYYFNVFSVKQHNAVPIFIMVCFGSTSLFLALRHFYRVTKLKYKRKSYAEYRLKRD